MTAIRLLGMFAHPDDEVFCAGGTLARYVAEGADAMVVSATRGEAGQIRDARTASRRTLAEVRECELRECCARLGVQRVRFLDYLDGTLGDVDRPKLLADIAGVFAEFRPDVVITFGPDGAYGHPDHIAVGEAATEVFAGYAKSSPDARLFHSHFPRSRLLMLDRLADWLDDFEFRFHGGSDFVRAFSLFAQETTTMGYTSDHVDVAWYPPRFCIVEQGERGASLYLILSGEVEVTQEQPDGSVRHLRVMKAGQFFGELGVTQQRPRTAQVTAKDSVTCLVFSPGKPTAYAGRGSVSPLAAVLAGADQNEDREFGATTMIDVSKHLDQKIAAIAAHRSQYPIEPDFFPPSMLAEMMGREYFVRVHPPPSLETSLLS